jgi:hypothetical protein
MEGKNVIRCGIWGRMKMIWGLRMECSVIRRGEWKKRLILW